MKLILEILMLFIYRKSPYYIIKRTVYIDTKYHDIWLYRKDYILYHIPILIPIDNTNNLGKGLDTVAKWYKEYDKVLNTKHTITDIEIKK